MSTKGRELLGDLKQEENYSPDRRVVLIAIFFLVFVMMLVAILHLCARYVICRNRRGHATTVGLFRSSSRSRRRRLATSSDSRTGLDSAAIATLPTFAHHKGAATNDGVERESYSSVECAVCLSAVEEGEMVRQLPNCKHLFHLECIDMWLHTHSTCPVCRADAEPKKVETVEASAPPPPPHELFSGGGAAAGDSMGSKEVASTSGLGSSFRRMLSRDWSGRRVHAEGAEDLERQ